MATMQQLRSPTARRGFTLVELSIVLVIIALLTGAIAGLHTYTRNATVATLMNQAKIYIDGYNQFQTIYNAPPGDYATASSAWTAAGDGDGNGLIRADVSNAPNGYRVELFYAFQHLALAGFIQGTYSGSGGGSFDAQIGTNIAGDPKEKVGYLFDHPDYADGTPDGFIASNTHPLFFYGNYPNVLRIAKHSNTTGLPDEPFLTASQAQSLDEKYDDGLPATGTVLTPKNSVLDECATTDNPIANTPVLATAAAAYTVNAAADKNNITCWILVKIQ